MYNRNFNFKKMHTSCKFSISYFISSHFLYSHKLVKATVKVEEFPPTETMISNQLLQSDFLSPSISLEQAGKAAGLYCCSDLEHVHPSRCLVLRVAVESARRSVRTPEKRTHVDTPRGSAVTYKNKEINSPFKTVGFIFQTRLHFLTAVDSFCSSRVSLSLTSNNLL